MADTADYNALARERIRAEQAALDERYAQIDCTDRGRLDRAREELANELRIAYRVGINTIRWEEESEMAREEWRRIAGVALADFDHLAALLGYVKADGEVQP